jgi:threonine/homoserine/homoserine lactone efflux protein
VAEQTPSERRPSLTDGIVVGVANPKAWIAIGAVFASARVADTAVADAALKISLLRLMIVLIHLMWLGAGRLLMPALRTPRRARAVNIVLAGLMVMASTVTVFT